MQSHFALLFRKKSVKNKARSHSFVLAWPLLHINKGVNFKSQQVMYHIVILSYLALKKQVTNV